MKIGCQVFKAGNTQARSVFLIGLLSVICHKNGLADFSAGFKVVLWLCFFAGVLTELLAVVIRLSAVLRAC